MIDKRSFMALLDFESLIEVREAALRFVVNMARRGIGDEHPEVLDARMDLIASNDEIVRRARFLKGINTEKAVANFDKGV